MVVRQDWRCLVFRRGEYRRILMPGRQRRPRFALVETYSIYEEFEPRSSSLEFAITKESIAAELDVVPVGDGQIALWFVDGIFNKVLTSGKHAFWKTITENTFNLTISTTRTLTSRLTG